MESIYEAKGDSYCHYGEIFANFQGSLSPLMHPKNDKGQKSVLPILWCLASYSFRKYRF